ncbi:hypothetical protein D0Y65_026666, partial [Glycine soja]
HVTRSLTVAQGFLSPAWPLFVATVDVTQGSLVSVLARLRCSSKVLILIHYKLDNLIISVALRSSHTSYVAELDLFWDLNPGQASPTTTTTTMGYFDLNIPYPEPSLANKATEQGPLGPSGIFLQKAVASGGSNPARLGELSSPGRAGRQPAPLFCYK